MADGGSGKRYILTIDGGGIRGIIPALILDALQRRIGETPLYRCFDLIAGTSTGGIIAAGLVAPMSTRPGGVACTPANLVDLYRTDGPRIFPHVLGLPRRVPGFPYRAKPLEAVLDGRIGTVAGTADALTNVVLPAYDLIGRRAVFMAGGPDYRTKAPREPSFPLHAAARATAAAPTYFPPAVVPDPAGGNDFLLCDGGLFANDPTVAAIVEAQKLGWALADLEILSIGTGQSATSFGNAGHWSALGWINPFRRVPILSILMQAGSSTISYEARRLVPAGQYDRADFRLIRGGGQMDDARTAHLDQLTAEARQWIAGNAGVLDDWAAKLPVRH